MVDIALELPDDLMAAYEARAKEIGISGEELMRRTIQDNAPAPGPAGDVQGASLADEPIVKAAEIEDEYRRLNYSLGWRFMTCPQSWARTAKLLLVSLNPAGRERHGPSWSQEAGSAYRVESWGKYSPGQAPLQRQVQSMFEILGLRDEDVFSAHYVPFRSPSWQELEHRDAAERFAHDLWKWLMPKIDFERVVCIGKDVPGRAMASLLGARGKTAMPVGWGEITADRYLLPDGRPLVALPHLSRFGIFGRPAGSEALRALFHD